ncbi:hypothetical protein [Actinomadura hibisca]|uniref:hypothetical protein n=1 Tax=Actinomadura hibisca TaxID=68565 RepID=UPI00082B858C|nr:hypothetical protein [Actinomadura hibisca]
MTQAVLRPETGAPLPAPQASARRRRTPRWAAPAAAVAVSAAVLAAHVERYGRWIVDDAGLTFAYARNIAEGHGVVSQPGMAPVEGYSNPLWLAVMLVGRFLGLFDRGTWFGVPDYVAFPKAAAFVCCLGIFVCFYLAARAVTRYPSVVTLVAGVALALNPSFVNYAFSGLENGLYGLGVAALTAVLVIAYSRERPAAMRTAALSAAAVLALVLTRPDGAIFAVAYPVLLVATFRWSRWRDALRALMVYAVVLGAPMVVFLAWRYTTFGLLVPAPALGKEQHVPDLIALSRVGELVEYAGWLTVLTLALLVGLLLSRADAAVRGGVVVIGGVLLVGLLDYGVLSWDWMLYFRFATPVWVAGSLLAGVVLVEGLRLAGRRTRVALVAMAVFGAAMSGATAWAHMVTRSEQPVLSLCHVVEQRSRTQETYADMLGIGSGTVALADLGGTLMTSRLKAVDLAGLTDITIARNYHRHTLPGTIDYLLTDVRPELIRLYVRWKQDRVMRADPRFQRDYVPIFGTRDYVRRDMVPSQEALERTRAWARTNEARMARRNKTAPLRSCGATLYPRGRG